MTTKIQTVSDFINSGIPKVTIQRILLETGGSENRFTKDPHFVMPDRFKPPKKLGKKQENNLKVLMTLSIQGYKKRNLKDKFLDNWFDKVDLLSLMKVKIYEITKEKLDIMKALSAIGSAITTAAGKTADTDFSVEEMYQIIQDTSDISEFNIKEFNILEELTSAVTVPLSGRGNDDLRGNSDPALAKKNQAKYETTTSNGSVIYNFPIKLDPYVYDTRDPEFLAYMVITEIDTQALINRIKSTIGGEADVILGSDVEQYIEEITSDIANKGISLDVIFNKSSLNNIGTLLQRNDNKEFWFGSYHIMPDGTIMTGVKHNDTTIPAQNRNLILIPVYMPNTKIIDLRDDDEIEKVLLKDLYQLENVFDKLSKSGGQSQNKELKAERPQLFSTSYISKRFDGAHSYLLGLDKVKMLFDKSLVRGIAKNLQPAFGLGPAAAPVSSTIQTKADAIIEDVLNKTEVEYLRIYRKRVSANKFGANRLGTHITNQESYIPPLLDTNTDNSYTDAFPILIAEYSTNGVKNNIKKSEGFNFTNNSSILEKRYLFLSFQDAELATFKDGQYEYFYEIVLKDGILRVLQEKLSSLLGYYTQIKNYINFINSSLEKYYNEGTDQFRYENINIDYPSINDVLDEALLVLSETALLFNFKIDVTYIRTTLFNIANPISGNYQGLLKFSNIFETFVTKMQKISGINTDVLRYFQMRKHNATGESELFMAPMASEGSISSLIDSTTALQKSSTELKNTIKIKENLADLADLENYNMVGYDYILSGMAKMVMENSLNASLGFRDIPESVFMTMVTEQISKYFLTGPDAADADSIGNPNGQYTTRYFTPENIALPWKNYSLSHSLGAPFPYQRDFKFYKPIILDILQYFNTKLSNKNKASDDILKEVKKLLNIAGTYGFVFDNNLYKQLGFLNDNINISDDDKYEDTSSTWNQQQQSSATNPLASGVVPPAEPDVMSDYEEAAAGSDMLPGLENYLYGILSNIILKNSIPIPEAYFQGEALLQLTLDTGNDVKSLPVPIQGLFVEYNVMLATLKKYLRGYLASDSTRMRETPLSLETFGWWWLNYANIVEVRYIQRYDGLFNPIWKPLTLHNFHATVGAGKRIVCKLFRYENADLGITHENEFLRLPILNEHFIISPGKVQLPPTKQVEDKSSTNKKMLETMERTLGSNKNALLNLDSKVKQNKMAKDLNSADLEELVMATQSSEIKTKGSAEFEGATIQETKGTAQSTSAQQQGPGAQDQGMQGTQGMQELDKNQPGGGFSYKG